MVENLEYVDPLAQTENQSCKEVDKYNDQGKSFLLELFANYWVLGEQETHDKVKGGEDRVNSNDDEHDKEDYSPNIAAWKHA